MTQENVMSFGRGADAEANDLIWQCINVKGSRCKGYSDDKRVNCELCPKFKEGIEKRRKNRAREEKFMVNWFLAESGKEFLLTDGGNNYSLVIGERKKDLPYPDKFEIKHKIELSLNDISDLSVFFNFSGRKLLDLKMSSRNR